MDEAISEIDVTGRIDDLDASGIDVDVASLSDEDLKAMREELANPDNGADAKKADDDEEEQTSDDDEEEKSDDESKDQEGEDDQETKDEEKKEEVPDKKEAKTSQEDDKAQLEKIQKQIEGQELLVKRKLSEIGAIKKQLQDDIKEIKAKLDDDAVLENPNDAVDNKLKLKDLQEQEEQLSEAEMAIVKQFEGAKTVATHIKPDQWSMENMEEVLKEDGFPQELIDKYKANPYSVAMPETIVQIAKRGHERALLASVVAAYRELETKYKELEKGKGKKMSSDDVISKVSKTLKASPEVTGKSGGSTISKKSVDISAQDIASMSLEDLKNLKKERLAQEHR